MRSRHRGFTIIELLVVIAVIAVLAAILFPVFGAARENVRKNICMANMHDIYVGASLFQQDHNRWPCLLLGYAERSDGLPWQPGSPLPVVPASQSKHHFLYPAYVKSVESFHCPDNPDESRLTGLSRRQPHQSSIGAAVRAYVNHVHQNDAVKDVYEKPWRLSYLACGRK